MADSSIPVVGSGGGTFAVDTRTQTNGDHREVVSLGDPDAAAVANVLTAAPTGAEAGLVVRLAGAPQTGPEVTAARAILTPTTTSQTVWAARAARRSGSIYNDSDGDAYVTFAATSTVAGADIVVGPDQLYELPVSDQMRITTAVSVIWATASAGSLRTVEWF